MKSIYLICSSKINQKSSVDSTTVFEKLKKIFFFEFRIYLPHQTDKDLTDIIKENSLRVCKDICHTDRCPIDSI